MLLASTNCVGAVWWECIIILAPLLFIRNRIRYEREGRFRAINVILHRETRRPTAPHTPLPPPCFARCRIEHPCVFPLGRCYPSAFAVVVTRSKRGSRVQRRAPGTCGARRDWSRGR